MFDNILELLKNYTDNYSASGIARLIIDIVLVIAVLVFCSFLFRKKIRVARMMLVLFIYAVVYALVICFDLQLMLIFVKLIGFWIVGMFLILYSQELRYSLESFFSLTKRNNTLSSKEEKEEIIKTIVSTVDYLSRRKVGALITFEREDSLDSIIQKAISIDANITEEIITTIFTPGTACHDGGMIIRSNKIICAGAYYPSTDQYDVPKSLGTRHRAAIGISERYDAFTIIVSEETGNISVTISGHIDTAISLDRLREVLDRYLLNK